MRYNKSTRYALYAALEMTRSDSPVTVAATAARYDIPEGALAKVLQDLVRAGLAHGVRGVNGGYVLARPAAKVTVLDVLTVFDPPRALGDCVLHDGHGVRQDACDETRSCRIRRLFDEVDETARSTFASVTLETLAR